MLSTDTQAPSLVTRWPAVRAFRYVAEALYLVLVPSSSLTGRARVERIHRDVAPTADGQGTIVNRETREVIHNTIEAAEGTKLRDAVRNTLDAIGYKLDGAAGFAIRGADMAQVIAKVDAILANATLYNAGAVHCRVTVRTPHLVPADAASMADVISGSLADGLATIREVCKAGRLPGAKGEASGTANLRSIFNTYKHLPRLGQTPMIEGAIKDALAEAREIKRQVEAWIEAQATAPSADAIATFASAIPTAMIDQAITLAAPADHAVWETIQADPVLAVAQSAGSADAAADLGGLL
jgi:hypothetical protein